MEVERLKNLRTVVPGALVLIGMLPFVALFTDSEINISQGVGWVTAGFGLLAAGVIGYFYNLYCSRAIFNRASHTRITANIKNRLLQIGRTAPLTPARRAELLSGGELMDVFYSFVDSNNSLREKAKLVRNNGLVWSSVADAVVIGAAFAVLYAILWTATRNTSFLLWALGSGAVVMLAILAHGRAEREQIRLGNDQLDFMASQLRDEVTKKVNSL